jgi:hypothetical protein
VLIPIFRIWQMAVNSSTLLQVVAGRFAALIYSDSQPRPRTAERDRPSCTRVMSDLGSPHFQLPHTCSAHT